jgi:hypothetical protein
MGQGLLGALAAMLERALAREKAQDAGMATEADVVMARMALATA